MINRFVLITFCMLLISCAKESIDFDPRLFAAEAMADLLSLPSPMAVRTAWSQYDKSDLIFIDVSEHDIPVHQHPSEIIHSVYIANLGGEKKPYHITWLIESNQNLYALVKYRPGICCAGLLASG